MLNYLKKKFSPKKDKDVPSTEQFYTPWRIALHSTIRLNTVDLLVIKDQLHPLFALPQGNLEVLAIGTLDMDGTPVHQVYVSDETNEEYVLQLVEGKDYRTREPQVDEVTLFKQVLTIEPETDTSLERALADIGFMDIELDGVVYLRVWGDNYTEKMDFRTYKENIVTPAGNQQYTDNYILYGRHISGVTGDDITELLLVGLEENESEAQIMMQVGLQLNVPDVQVQ